MKCRAKRVHAPRSRPLFTRVLHAARSPSTQRRSRPPFTRFCNVHALCSRIYRPVHAHRSRFRCTVHAWRSPVHAWRSPVHADRHTGSPTGRVSVIGSPRAAASTYLTARSCRPVSWLLLRGPAWSATTTAPAADARRTAKPCVLESRHCVRSPRAASPTLGRPSFHIRLLSFRIQVRADDQVIRENPASRGTETSADVLLLVGPPGALGRGIRVERRFTRRYTSFTNQISFFPFSGNLRFWQK